MGDDNRVQYKNLRLRIPPGLHGWRCARQTVTDFGRRGTCASRCHWAEWGKASLRRGA